jgi:hypothetical protein
MDFIKKIKQSARKKILYTQHALDEMNAEDEMITTEEVTPCRFCTAIIYPCK